MIRRTIAPLVILALLAPALATAQPIAVVVAYDSPVEGYAFAPGGLNAAGIETLRVDRGGSLTLVNASNTEYHSVRSVETRFKQPLFDSGLVAPGDDKDVTGVSYLSPGSYRFYCLWHQHQQGTLVVS